jgi:hypothetical protein
VSVTSPSAIFEFRTHFFRYEMHRGWAIAIARCGGEPELEPELEPGVQLI